MRTILFAAIVACCCWAGEAAAQEKTPEREILSVVVDPGAQDLRLYWKDESGKPIGNMQRLKEFCDRGHQRLVFAMNGGMFKADRSPLGLFIQEGKAISPLDRSAGEWNFYLQPNGVFFLTNDRRGGICTTSSFRDSGQIVYATQSGPMLLVDGAIHPAFRAGSTNLNVRNGVGILPDGRILFALSREPVNFYAFAEYFRSRGCRNALYLDGFVSRAYAPDKDWKQMDGDLGVLMGVTIPQ